MKNGLCPVITNGLPRFPGNVENPALQKENPVSKVLPKVRANYANICFKLAKVLGKKDDDDDSGLDDYE